MRRIVLVSVLSLLAVGGVTAARLSRPRAECPVVDGDGLPTDMLTDRRGADMPAAPLGVHEWGVWRLSSAGRVASLEELVRESPSFVHRSAEAATGVLPMAIPPEYQICDKPVIFLHAGTTMDVRITVGFPTGRPYLHYPEATDGMANGSRGLQWYGQVNAPSTPVDASAYRPASASHWWSFLRSAGASPFVSSASHETESFLFYDGETRFPDGFRARRRRITPIAGHVDSVAWQLESGHASHLDIAGARMTRRSLASVDALRADMKTTLMARGLTAGESDSLLDTWRSNLFAGDERRVIWMLPRATYDAMLPLTVTPTPTEVVRVGVVVQVYGR